MTLASLCARLSASKGSERLVCEALVVALGGTHGVEHAPRGRARDAPPLVVAST